MTRSVWQGAVALSFIMLAGCSSGDFMVSKNTDHFYVTSNGPQLRQVLCDSGDMDEIARQSKLPATLQKDLKEGICAVNKDKKRLLNTLNGMTKEQRAALEDAFRQNGYSVNVIVNSSSLF